jgi:hypothetical protein
LNRPLLMLDVDGPLNPFLASPADLGDYTEHSMKPPSWIAQHDAPAALVAPLTVWLNPGHGPALLELDFELVWATTWVEDANEWIGPVLGLPELPYVSWPQPRPAGSLLHWKTQSILDFAAGRPFAWVDDEIRAQDREWIEERYPADALLHTVDASRGLRELDFQSLAEWADSLAR